MNKFYADCKIAKSAAELFRKCGYPVRMENNKLSICTEDDFQTVILKVWKQSQNTEFLYPLALIEAFEKCVSDDIVYGTTVENVPQPIILTIYRLVIE